jgi:Histidine kinase-, DNA gyrase B-, and HSP90-like ATPase
MQKLERTTFETSRTAEYFDQAGLSKQTGQVPNRFAEVVIKELADNALDAAEYARVAPEVEITAQEKDSVIILSVADNGPGIPPKTVQKMLDFNTRTSDKAVYRSPTRGAQGNALKTIVGMPHALGSGKNPVLIDSQGARHLIKVVADPAGELTKERTIERCQRTTGTRVTVALPEATQFFSKAELLHWGRSVAVFNPHAFVKVAGSGLDNYHGGSPGRDVAGFYKPLAEGFAKYTPGEPTSAHWYDEAALKTLVFSHIRHARAEGGQDLPLGKFVRQFKGLSSTAKAREVCSHFPEIDRLSDFEGRGHGVALLLYWMKQHSKPPAHKALGRLGKDHIRARLEDFYGHVERYRYKHFAGYLPSGLPYTFEFAVAEVDELGDLFVGVNFSPTLGDPLQDLRLKGKKYEASGIEEFLEEGFAHPLHEHADDPESPLTAAVAHVVTPAPLFMEYGKTRLDLMGRT